MILCLWQNKSLYSEMDLPESVLYCSCLRTRTYRRIEQFDCLNVKDLHSMFVIIKYCKVYVNSAALPFAHVCNISDAEKENNNQPIKNVCGHRVT